MASVSTAMHAEFWYTIWKRAHHRNIFGWPLIHMAAETLHFGDVHTTAQEFPMQPLDVLYDTLLHGWYHFQTRGNWQLAGSSDREMVPQHCPFWSICHQRSISSCLAHLFLHTGLTTGGGREYYTARLRCFPVTLKNQIWKICAVNIAQVTNGLSVNSSFYTLTLRNIPTIQPAATTLDANQLWSTLALSSWTPVLLVWAIFNLIVCLINANVTAGFPTSHHTTNLPPSSEG